MEVKAFLIQYITNEDEQCNHPDVASLSLSNFMTSLIESPYHISLAKEGTATSTNGGSGINGRQFLMDQGLLSRTSFKPNHSMFSSCFFFVI